MHVNVEEISSLFTTDDEYAWLENRWACRTVELQLKVIAEPLLSGDISTIIPPKNSVQVAAIHIVVWFLDLVIIKLLPIWSWGLNARTRILWKTWIFIHFHFFVAGSWLCSRWLTRLGSMARLGFMARSDCCAVDGWSDWFDPLRREALTGHWCTTHQHPVRIHSLRHSTHALEDCWIFVPFKA